MATVRAFGGLAALGIVGGLACGDDTGGSATASFEATTLGGDVTGSESAGESGGGTTAGDGDSGDGDGDGTTMGTTATGDGDGDGTTMGTTAGDGDGTSATSGDGDGDGTSATGDGDGDGTSSGDGDGSTGGDGDGTTTGDGDGTTGDGDGDGDPMCLLCAPNTDLVYVLSDAADLWSFDPVSLQFTFVVDLPCPGLIQNTFSMSVDRRGIAWVLYQDGTLYTIDVNNPTACINPGWTTPPAPFTAQFGMGFASNGNGDRCENLYAHSFSGGGFSEGPNIGNLARIEPSTLGLTIQGPTNYNGGELTGNAAGQLFAFAGVPAKLIEFDKNTGMEIGTPITLTGLDLTNAFAFATYDGRFYFFTEETGTFPTTSKVNLFDPAVPGVYTQVASAPIRIVGAGVSTCAPSPQ